jgi:PAS domain S-box-containing protein
MTVGLSRDITAERMAVDTLRESEQRFVSFMDNNPAAAVIKDSEGRYVYINKPFEKYFQTASADVLGKKDQDLYLPDQAAVLREHDALVLAENRAMEFMETVRTPDGVDREWMVFKFPVRGRKGDVFVGVVGVDVTDQKRLQASMIQSEKLSAVGQLAAGVAHEINNPLGVILGFAQGAAKRLATEDPMTLAITSIEREAKRCKNLVQDLLTFSRTSISGRESMDLNHAVEGALSLVEARAKVCKVELKKELGAGLPTFAGNQNQIQQVVVNLANNAMDAMPQGGTLSVSSSTVEEKGRTWLLLRVADSGEGIPPEIVPRIFEPFFTTKPVGKGTGLGLSLVYEIVKKHQGDVTVESRKGLTRFDVRFPAERQAQAAPRTSGARA